jgi:hypothetical protein
MDWLKMVLLMHVVVKAAANFIACHFNVNFIAFHSNLFPDALASMLYKLQ